MCPAPLDPFPEGYLDELELDLLTVICRLDQIAREGIDAAGGLVLERLLTCDAPRLRRHLTPRARNLAEIVDELERART